MVCTHTESELQAHDCGDRHLVVCRACLVDWVRQIENNPNLPGPQGTWILKTEYSREEKCS